VATSHRPGEPDPADLRVLAVLQARDGVLTEVALSDGQVLPVWDIAWGYDAGDSWAHVSTNISPGPPGSPFDVFSTSEVLTVRAPETGDVLFHAGRPG
jgi:hypothetical protein